MTQSTPVWEYITTRHAGNVTHAASALGVDPSTLHRVMNSGYVINGRLYTIKRKAK
jgi:DNA-binding protein Fis